MSSRVVILGIPIDPVLPQEAVAQICALLQEPGTKQVATPNAEMIVASVHSPEYRTVFQRTALNIPDSVSLRFAAMLTGQYLPARVTGVDTTSNVCAVLTPDHSVFLLGAAPGIAERAADVLRKKNPNLVIAGTWSGSPRPEEAADICQRITHSGAKLLFVAFGSPMQELWIDEHLSQLPSVRVAMGVGGTFDFLAGVQVRAPQWMRSLGLEWAWRFAHQPSRWKRMANAVLVFPWLVLRYGKNVP